MNDNVSKYSTFMKWVALMLSWLTLSPVFYYLDKRWNLFGKAGRTFLLLFSPLFLFLYLGLFFGILFWQADYSRKHYFQDRDRIERITWIRIPEFRVIDYEKGERSFTGDFSDRFTFEFKEVPPDELFDKIDSLMATGNSDWTKVGDDYHFDYSLVLGENPLHTNVLPYEMYQRDFSMDITRGKKRGVIRHETY